MSENDVLLGLGLVLVLAVGARLAAEIGPAGAPRLYFTDTSFDRDDADAPAGA